MEPCDMVTFPCAPNLADYNIISCAWDNYTFLKMARLVATLWVIGFCINPYLARNKIIPWLIRTPCSVLELMGINAGKRKLTILFGNGAKVKANGNFD